MQLTTEQKSILQSTKNITINAVAGSGKTTTLIEFAKVLPPQSSILYLAFNKSVKLEAEKKFKEAVPVRFIAVVHTAIFSRKIEYIKTKRIHFFVHRRQCA